MKRLIKYIAIAFLATFMTASCDFLNEFDPNSTTTGDFYKTEADVDLAVNAVYDCLTSSYYFGSNSFYFTDVRAHSTVYNSSGTNGGIPYAFYNFTLNEENSYVEERYVVLNRTVARCNNLLFHLDDVTYAKPETRQVYEAEARFIRALTHLYLVVEFGDVPLVLKKLESVDEVKANTYRSPKAKVYQAIFDDLGFVLDSPVQTICPADNCGRISKAAAHALLGRAYLQYACDESFAETKDEALTNAVTNLTAAWGMKTFTNLSDIKFADIFDLKTQKGCPENIFQVNYISGNANACSSWNYNWGPATTGITSMAKGSELNFTDQDTYDRYDSKDIRRGYLRPFKIGGAGVTYYHTMKFVDLDCGVDGYGGNNWPVIRYADVALMLAEAYYWSGDEANAKKWLNMVRKRAGLADWNGTDLRQGIYDERLFEFIHEGLRWHDMLRMYTEEEMVTVYQALNTNFDKADLLLPIPYSERILNPEGMYQNYGY